MKDLILNDYKHLNIDEMIELLIAQSAEFLGEGTMHGELTAENLKNMRRDVSRLLDEMRFEGNPFTFVLGYRRRGRWCIRNWDGYIYIPRCYLWGCGCLIHWEWLLSGPSSHECYKSQKCREYEKRSGQMKIKL